MLTHKTIFITGASSGLGRALAIGLAKTNSNLVLMARNVAELEKTRTLCLDINPMVSLIIIKGDVCLESDCAQAIKTAIIHFGQLDYLILNAGVSMSSTFEELPNVSILKKLIETNYLGAANCIFPALPYLKKTHGMIVAISSIQGKISIPFRSGYCASKHALQSFLDVLRLELHDKIDILSVCPGWIKGTNLRENSYNDNKKISAKALMRQQRDASSLEYCVQQILQAMIQRKKELIFPAKYRFLPWLNLLCPMLLRYLSMRRLELEYEE